MKKISIKTALIITLLLLGGCSLKEEPVKNIILLIGDGMGPSHLGLLETYATRAPNSIYHGNSSSIAKFAKEGKTFLSDPAPFDALVVDSACSATQLSIGETSRSEMIGLNDKGIAVETLLQAARLSGKATGLVSDTRITHATPAAFAAHVAHRRYENDIASDLINNQVDVLLSGGLGYFLPKTDNLPSHLFEKIAEAKLPLLSKRADERNLLLDAEKSGYSLAFNNAQLNAIQSPPVLGLFQSSSMPDALLEKNNKNRAYPSLKEMTQQALRLLEKNKQGFVLMIEGGQIDWAAHNSDAGALLHELIRFDEAVQVVHDWAKNRSDTLVVITADHETGGFGFSYSAANIPVGQLLASPHFATNTFQPDFNFGSLNTLDKLYAQQKGFYTLWRDAAAKSNGEHPSVSDLIEAVNQFTKFTITTEQAEAILAHSNNRYHQANHSTLQTLSTPHVHDFSAFYVYGEDVHLNLLGRALSEQQNVVWSTGTHTSSPVPVIVFGPAHATQQFQGFLTHPQIGSLLKQIATK